MSYVSNKWFAQHLLIFCCMQFFHFCDILGGKVFEMATRESTFVCTSHNLSCKNLPCTSICKRGSATSRCDDSGIDWR